jgi:hypothetical protein
MRRFLVTLAFLLINQATGGAAEVRLMRMLCSPSNRHQRGEGKCMFMFTAQHLSLDFKALITDLIRCRGYTMLSTRPIRLHATVQARIPVGPTPVQVPSHLLRARQRLDQLHGFRNRRYHLHQLASMPHPHRRRFSPRRPHGRTRGGGAC